MDLCDEWASDDETGSEVSKAAAIAITRTATPTPFVVQNDESPSQPQTNGQLIATTETEPKNKNTVLKVTSSSSAILLDASTNTDNDGPVAKPRSKQPQQQPPPPTKDEKNHSHGGRQFARTCVQPAEPVVYVPPQPPQLDEEIFGQEIVCGQNFGKYANIPVKASGENVPPPIESFAASGLADLLLENVRKSGYMQPTPIQKHGIATILAGRDLMACAQTGSGKTAAFLLAILHRLLTDEEGGDHSAGGSGGGGPGGAPAALRPLAVIITPTRELAVQIFNEARKFARDSYLRACVLYGGTSVNYQLQQLQRGGHVLVATPGRLLDFVDAGWVRFDRVRFVVLDEADRMLDMGFLPDIQLVMEHTTMVVARERRQTLMFSATFPNEIQELAGRMLRAYVFIAVGIVGSACDDVLQTVLMVEHRQKRERLLELLEGDERQRKESGEGDRAGGTMVFVSTRRLADFLATYLSELGHLATSIHGDRYQQQREEALCDFRQQRMKVLVCTSVAARGLNIKNVVHVINFDMPNSIDEYVHRIGRTGRMGNQGRATTFFDPDADAVLASDLVTILEQAAQEVPQFLLQQARCFGPAANGERTFTRRTEFGGLDMRQFRAQRRNREPVAHEPLVKW